jgi:cytochrome c556
MTMNTRRIFFAAVVAAAVLPFASVAHEGATGVVKERMDLMETIGKQFKEIGQRVQSNRNLPSIGERAAKIQEMSEKIPGLFPAGSLDRPTDAKATIWEQWDQFEARARDLRQAAGALSTAAPSGDPKLISERFKAVSRSCAACHDDFRQKKR